MYWPNGDNQNIDRLLGLSYQSDVRGRLLGWYLALGAILLLGGLFFATTLREQTLHLQVDADQRLTQIYAQSLTDPESVDAWASNIELPESYIAIIADPRGNVHHTIHSAESTTENIENTAWVKQISREARNATTHWFITIDDGGLRWLHTWTVIGAGGKLVLQRPLASNNLPANSFPNSPFFSIVSPSWPYYLPLLMVVLMLLGGLALWYLMSERWIVSINRLVELSETIRWRGFLRASEQQEFQTLAQQGGRVGRLASSLMAMEQETQARLTQLSTLLVTGQAVTASLDVTQVMDNILAQVQQLFNTQRCAVLTLDARANVFRIQASRGLTDEYVSRLRIATTEPNSPSMRALRNQQPIQIADTETDLSYKPFRARARTEGNRSVLAIPLATVHARPAVLLVYRTVTYRYSYSELELANLVGTHAVLALENAALYARTDEQLQEQTRRLDAIVESLHDGLVLESPDAQVIYSNQRAARLVGLRQRQMAGLAVQRLTAHLLAHAENGDAILEQIHAETASPKGQFAIDLSRTDPNGQPQDLRIHYFNVTDAQGELLGRGQLWQDITSDKELDRMKSSLISTVSHELRTPLATIKGYATTLLASDVEWDGAAQREFLQTISNEADRLADLVQNLLDMSRIEAGTLEINRQPYPFNQLIPEIIRSFPGALEKRIELSLMTDLPVVSIDAARIRTVVRNLLENSIKYSASGSPIEIATYAQDGDLICSVRDYGIGLPAELPNDIFEHFVRLDNRLSRDTGGFGLGLAISKGFVEAHGGEIWLQQESEGVRFGFSLPICLSE